MSAITAASHTPEGGHGDAAAYVLGALDEVARARFEAHAAACAECRRELDEFRPVADRLGLAVAQTAPPPRLKPQLLARVCALAQAAQQAAQPAPPGVLQPAMRRKWWQIGHRLSMAIAAASLAVALASGGFAFATHQQMRTTARTAAELAEVLLIMYQPGMVQRALTGTEMAPQAWGTVFLNPIGTEAIVQTYGMPRLARDQAYQCWLVSEEQRASAGVFLVDEKGRGRLIVHAPVALSRFRAVGVTKEPARGSRRSTGPRVLFGTL